MYYACCKVTAGICIPLAAATGNSDTRANQRRVTVAGKPSDDLASGTLNSILKQSGLKK
jgi:hypothetical protein